jgi:hypothetical protein
MNETLFGDILIPILVALIASSGFWAYFNKKIERKTLQTELLIGLAHDRITWLCMYYIGRGYITQDEYENLVTYLFKPYEALGGNGSARRFMLEVDKLPIKSIKAATTKGEN